MSYFKAGSTELLQPNRGLTHIAGICGGSDTTTLNVTTGEGL